VKALATALVTFNYAKSGFFLHIYNILFIYLMFENNSSTINKLHEDNGTNMLKVITGQNNTAAYVILQNQCRVDSTMHYNVQAYKIYK